MIGVAAGIDVAASGVRAALVDAAGGPIAIGAAPLDPAQLRDPAAWWSATCAAFASLGKQTLLDRVRAVAVAGASGIVLPLDVADQPIRPASLDDDPADPAAVALVERAAPSDSPARGANSPLAKALSWRLLPSLAIVLQQADWLAGRMLGRFRASDWNTALNSGFDPAANAWPGWVARLFPLALLPRPQEPGRPLGQMSEASARALGLPSGVLVAAGSTTGCATVLASGADRAGDGITSLGTTLKVQQLSGKPIASASHGVYSHRLGSFWLPGSATESGGGALARQFSSEQVASLSAQIDPARNADPQTLCGVSTGPAQDTELLHGLIEATARAEAASYAQLAALGGPGLTRVFSVGEGAHDPAWTAIRARMLGVPMVDARSEDPAVGAAMLALRSLH